VPSFDPVAGAYDDARPGYPDGVFDALEPLTGVFVLDGGSGTGIATRELRRRGADVVPFDIGVEMVRRTRSRSRGVPVVVADGAAMAFRDASADLLCFAQSWHWLDRDHRCDEAARVLRPGGRWGAWWSQPRADGEAWFDATWDVVESACPGSHRSQRDIDWAEQLRRSPRFEVAEPIRVPWLRRLSVEHWLADLATHSYVIALPLDARRRLITTLGEIATEGFPDGEMRVPYDTRLWVAIRT
jgi:SAM-dependent methyltransferase